MKPQVEEALIRELTVRPIVRIHVLTRPGGTVEANSEAHLPQIPAVGAMVELVATNGHYEKFRVLESTTYHLTNDNIANGGFDGVIRVEYVDRRRA